MRNRSRLNVIALAFSQLLWPLASAKPTGSPDDERRPKPTRPPASPGVTSAPSATPSPAPAKTIRLSKRTVEKFKEFTEIVKDMNEAKALASFLLAFAPFQTLLGGASPDGWVDIATFDWERTQTALMGLSMDYRNQLRYFCRDEQRIQDNSPADRKFWAALGDQFIWREPQAAVTPPPTPGPSPKPSPGDGPDRESHRGPPPKPERPPKPEPQPKPSRPEKPSPAPKPDPVQKPEKPSKPEKVKIKGPA